MNLNIDLIVEATGPLTGNRWHSENGGLSRMKQADSLEVGTKA